MRFFSDLFAAKNLDQANDDFERRLAASETPRLTSAVDPLAETATMPARANGRAAKR